MIGVTALVLNETQAGAAMSVSGAPEKAVSCLDLHPRIHSALKKAGLYHLSSILVYSSGDLVRRTGLSHPDVRSLLLVASKALLSTPLTVTALQMYQGQTQKYHQAWLSTGCPLLDKALHGGLLVPGVTEIAGTSAAGKTQLCLQLCLTVQLPREKGGLEGGAVYISTEDVFPNKRLQQLTELFARKCRQPGLSAQRLSDNIYVEHAATISSLSVQLQYKLPSLLSQRHVRLVVIDSMAALFRVEFSGSQASQRAQLLRSFGAQLRRLSDSFSTAVVCVNQVTAAIGSGSGKGGGEEGGGVKPALGLAWADMVTVRLMMLREEGVEDGEEQRKSPARALRTLQVLLAPHLPPTTVQYYIDSDGLHGVQETHSS